MGSRGPNAPRTHITASGWANANAPSIRRDEIEETLGRNLSDSVWTKIDRAFRHLNLLRDHQAAPAITGKGRNSYTATLRRSEKRIEKVLAELRKQKGERHINEAINKSQSRPFRRDLDSAITAVKELIYAIQGAQDPEPIEYLSEADAKARVVQEIKKVVVGEIDVEAPVMLRKGGFTDFQKLVYELNVHTAIGKQAFVEWLHDALRKKIP